MGTITELPLSLSDEERKCLGLAPVGDTWGLVTFLGHRVYLCLEGDIIRERIEIGADGCYYEERELFERTERERTILLDDVSCQDNRFLVR